MRRPRWLRRLTDAQSPTIDAELLAGVACALAVALVGVALWLRASAGAFDFRVREEAVVRPKAALRAAHDSMAVTYTHDGGTIRWYVLVDPETRVQYLVNDRGGCCVRVGWDGEAMGLASD